MHDLAALRGRVERLDGQGYPRYKAIKGSYDAGRFELRIDHVQGDPFARPSRLRARLSPTGAALPAWATATADRRRAAADFLNRRFAVALAARSERIGSGRGGELRILRPEQQVLERASLTVTEDGAIEARFRAGLPARGRRIMGRAAARLLTETVPAAVLESLPFTALDAEVLRRHVLTVEDAVALRSQLEQRGLVAFIADGSILPRRSGIDDRPLEPDRARPFRSPPELRIRLDTPNTGPVDGMGIPRGVTLIVGGGYHGKSTLLRAIERGVYDHPPGDGRERVVAIADAVKVRAEDGRRIEGTDISNFIAGLPGDEDTRRFRTENASGSTSQAAAITEALEIGARCLLLDEDTSATNFMIRDARMQALIPREHEPITPFLDRARELARDHGVSTILVVGGSGDYFDVADVVIAMHEYEPMEVTARAKRVAAEQPTGRRAEARRWEAPRRRRLVAESVDATDRRGRIRIRIHARDRLDFGETEVDLGALEQLVERAQTAAIAQALVWAGREVMQEGGDVGEIVAAVAERIRTMGVASVDPEPIGEYSAFRPHELAACLNRLRTLQTR